jgi:hypothetical protein
MVLNQAITRRRVAKQAFKAAEKEYQSAQRGVLALKDTMLKMFDEPESNENSYSSKNPEKLKDKP